LERTPVKMMTAPANCKKIKLWPGQSYDHELLRHLVFLILKGVVKSSRAFLSWPQEVLFRMRSMLYITLGDLYKRQ
jgi:hypothetical protein